MGAFGTVWKAHDTELDRTVAIKIPRQGQLNAEDSDKFRRADCIAAVVNDIAIVRLPPIRSEDVARLGAQHPRLPPPSRVTFGDRTDRHGAI